MGERRQYTEELRAEAVKMVVAPGSPSVSDVIAENRRLRKELAKAKMEQGASQQEVGNLLGVPKGTIGSWVAKCKKEMIQLGKRS